MCAPSELLGTGSSHGSSDCDAGEIPQMEILNFKKKNVLKYNSVLRGRIVLGIVCLDSPPQN